MFKKILYSTLVVFAMASTFFGILGVLADHDVFFALIFTVIYFIPSFVTKIRRHHNLLPIFLVNWLLGWTLIGWVITLIWPLLRKEPIARTTE
jgi:hypothetical protein